MLRAKITSAVTIFSLALTLGSIHAQEKEQHRRGYKPPPPVSHLEVTVLTPKNKPIQNAGVILRANRNGRDLGNMELKTGPDGKAMIDIIETGSNVQVQVIATGYKTYGSSFDMPEAEKNYTVKMERPTSQYSLYDGAKTDNRGAGVRELSEKQTRPATAKPLAPGDPVIKLSPATPPVDAPPANDATQSQQK